MASECVSSSSSGLADLKKLSNHCQSLLDRLRAIETEQELAGSRYPQFSRVLQQVGIFLRYSAAVEAACEPKADKKRLCIKFKDLDLAFVRQLDSRAICWKYLLCLFAHFNSTMEAEFEQPLKWYDYYGDFELSDLFTSKIQLLVRSIHAVKNRGAIH